MVSLSESRLLRRLSSHRWNKAAHVHHSVVLCNWGLQSLLHSIIVDVYSWCISREDLCVNQGLEYGKDYFMTHYTHCVYVPLGGGRCGGCRLYSTEKLTQRILIHACRQCSFFFSWRRVSLILSLIDIFSMVRSCFLFSALPIILSWWTPWTRG